MDIESALSGATATASATAEKTKSQSDLDNFIGTRDDFLTILLAQLKNQDPLDPMEGTEFIDSITRLSSVEQAVNQNQQLEKIVDLLGGGNVDFGSPVSYLDKFVEFESDKFAVEGGEGKISYALDEGVDDVFIHIKNLSGDIVYAGKGEKEAGTHQFVWDGKDADGNQLSDGVYEITVSYPEDEKVNQIASYTTGVVTGANFQGENVQLVIGKINAPLENVISIRKLDENNEVVEES